LILAVAVAAVVTGCVGTVRQFQVTFPADAGSKALPGLVNDQTGLVTRVAAAQPGPAPVMDDFMSHDPRTPNIVVIQWLGGGCDERVEITVEGPDNLEFVIAPKAPAGACDGVGVPRAVFIELSVPIDSSRSGFRMDRGSADDQGP
jgi:hypothetical protein